MFDTTYLRQEIRLEIGPLAEWVPSHSVAITSMVAEQFPMVFNQLSTVVSTVDVERTFWEKVTILHKTACSCMEKCYNNLCEGNKVSSRNLHPSVIVYIVVFGEFIKL